MNKLPSVVTLGLLVAFASQARELNVLDAGAVADGATDNTAAFQQLLDEAGQANGGIVHVPTGYYRINGNLRIPAGVVLKGTYTFAPCDRADGSARMHGSVLLAYAGRGEPDAAPFIKFLGSNSGLIGIMITYPEFSPDQVPPVPYPPTAMAGFMDNVTIQNCCFLNSYEAMRFSRTGRFFVSNVTGFPVWRGLFVDMCLDVGRIENAHFWPFGSWWSQDRPLAKWMAENAVAFEFARYDWGYVFNTFCFGYGTGYHFIRSTHPESSGWGTNGNFVGIGADSCEHPIHIEATQGPGLLITNAELVGHWGSDSSIGILIDEQAPSANVSLTNSAFWGPLTKCIWARSPHTNLTVNGCNFANWDLKGAGVPAIDVDGGKAIIQGSSFLKEGTHVDVAAGVRSAIIMGNQASAGVNVTNRAGARTQILGNETDLMVWTDEARRHYMIDIGSDGDGRYLTHWHGPETAPEWPQKGGAKRWSAPGAELHLPVVPGEKYSATLEIYLLDLAMAEDAGIYLGDQKLADLPSQPGRNFLTIELPPAEEDEIVLSVKPKIWVPAETLEGSGDMRPLGIALRTMTLQADGAPERLFNANDGTWYSEAE